MEVYVVQQSASTAAERRGYFRLIQSADGISPRTGASGTGMVSKNGAAAAASTNNIVEIDAGDMPGWYYIEPTTTEINTLGITAFVFDDGSSLPATVMFMVIPDNPYAAAPTANELAAALLKLDLTTVTGEATRSVLNAIRVLRNRKSVDTGTDTVTVYKEDDSTSAFTIVYTGTDPVITDANPT